MYYLSLSLDVVQQRLIEGLKTEGLDDLGLGTDPGSVLLGA